MSAQPVLVCFAVSHERRFFRPVPEWNCRVVVTGIGRGNARRGLERALERERPALVLTCGYAGGLNPDLQFGQVVFEDEGAQDWGELGREKWTEKLEASRPDQGDRPDGDARGEEGRGKMPNGKWQMANGSGLGAALLELGALRVRFLESDHVVVTAREKAGLWQTTGADAVEMESAEIRRICQQRGIPVATIRVISDTAAEDLPLDFNQVSGSDQNLSYAKLAVRVVRSPALIGRLLHLQRRLNGAARRLAEVLEGTLARGQQATAKGGGF